MLFEYRLTISINVNRHSKVKLRFATPSGRLSYKHGQEADNDQKRTPQSLHMAYVNKSTGSHRSQPPTGAEHWSSFRALGTLRHQDTSALNYSVAEVSDGHSGTGAKVSWCRSVLVSKCPYTALGLPLPHPTRCLTPALSPADRHVWCLRHWSL